MNRINPTNFLQIPAYPKKAVDRYHIHAVIETPRNIRHKYAFDPKFGIFKLKQTIPEGLAWPYDYGFVPCTLGDDGDPLDILYLNEESTFTGCLVECRLIGIVLLKKNGEENDRLVACAQRMPGVNQRTDKFDDIDDVPPDTLDSISRFLVEYSAEQDNKIELKGVASRKKALRAVEKGAKDWRKHTRR